MKTKRSNSIFLLSILITIFLVLGTSCEKNQINPDDSLLTVKPTVELFVPSRTIPYGAYVTVSWKSNAPSTFSCTLNGQKVKPVDSIKIRLFADTTFYFQVKKDSLSNKIEKIVKVNPDWISSRIGILNHTSWLLKGLEYIQDGKVVHKFSISNQDPKNDLHYFYIRDDYWSLSDDDAYILGTVGYNTKYLIVLLTKNDLILDTESSFKDKPAIFRLEYYAP